MSALTTPEVEPITLPLTAHSTPGIGAGAGDVDVVDHNPSGSKQTKDKGKGHRRHRSLLESLGWGKSSKGSRSNASNSGDLDTMHQDLDGFHHAYGGGGGGGANQQMVEGGSGHGSSTTSASPPTIHPAVLDIALLEIEAPPQLPAGARGISNIGNSCFLNAALQCLRHTPDLPLILTPDLLERAEVSDKERADAEASLPRGGETNGSGSGEVEGNEQEKQGDGVPSRPIESMNGDDIDTSGSGSGEETNVEKEGTGAVPVAADAVDNNDSDAVVDEETSEDAITKQEQPQQTQEAEGEEKLQSQTNADAISTDAQPSPAPQQQQQQQEKPRPLKGEIASTMATLFTDLFLAGPPTAGPTPTPPASPQPLLNVLRRYPVAAEYFDGRQQDCQEVLQVVLDLLHEDLDRNNASIRDGGSSGKGKEVKEEEEEEEGEGGDDVGGDKQQEQADEEQTPPPISVLTTATTPTISPASLPPLPPLPPNRPTSPPPPPPPTLPREEAAKADAAWATWQKTTDSPISDLFMGQLQSSVSCYKCGGRFTMYEPFFELSLPLAPKPGGAFSWLSFKAGTGLSLQDCLRLYTADEKLEGKEAFHCETCGEKTSAVKHLRLHRLPQALILHIKRFRHAGLGATSADKLTTDVTFPLKSLDLHEHLSPESNVPPEHCIYDLYAVSYHTGTLAGGHYLAACRVGEDRWWQFNDEHVTIVPGGVPKTQNAYILFYARRKFKDPGAAAVAYAARDVKGGNRHRHTRSRSGGSSGGGGFFGGGGGSNNTPTA